MQKTREASILIWALFLSLFISFAFLALSTAVNKGIKGAGSIEGLLDSRLSPNTYTSDSDFEETQIGTLALQKDISNIVTLKKDVSFEARFTGTSLIDFTVTINSGGPLFYSFLAFNGTSLIGTVTASGTVTTSSSFNGSLNTTNNTGILYVKNLGSYADFYFTSSQNPTLPVEEYSLKKNIGGVNFEKSSIERQNFVKGDYSGLNYESYEIEF